MFFRGDTPKRLFHETVAVMPDVAHETFIVKREARLAGLSYGELKIHDQMGIAVIGVKRGGEIIRGISDDFRFKEGDIVFLIGDRDSLNEIGRVFF